MIRLREMTADDWPAVEKIYAQGIEDGEATFEVATPTWAAFDAGKLPGMRIVAVDGGDAVIGWAAASAISSRPAYRGVVEHSVYIHRSARGQGIGRLLLTELVAGAEADGFWTVQTGIFPENSASLALHRECGFRVVGTRQRIGQLAGVWRDVVFLEHRRATD